MCVIKIKSLAYSSQGNHTSQLDFCIQLADGKHVMQNQLMNQDSNMILTLKKHT